MHGVSPAAARPTRARRRSRRWPAGRCGDGGARPRRRSQCSSASSSTSSRGVVRPVGAPLDVVVERVVHGLGPLAFGAERGDVRQDVDRGVEQHRTADAVGMRAPPARGPGGRRRSDRPSRAARGRARRSSPRGRRRASRTSTVARSLSGRVREGRGRRRGTASPSAPPRAAKRSPCAVTPCRQTTAGAVGSPHSWTCRLTSAPLFAVARTAVVRRPLQLVRQVVDVEAARVVVRVHVALAVAELAAVVAPVAQRLRRPRRCPLAHVCGRLVDRDVARVRLRRAREVDRRLREVEPGLGQADVLHRLRGRDGDEQCARIGVADVLGREHDHAPRDEARVLSALEHRREVVDGGVGIAAAHRLDERGGEVVVRVRALVVESRPLARGVLDVRLGDRRRSPSRARARRC